MTAATFAPLNGILGVGSKKSRLLFLVAAGAQGLRALKELCLMVGSMVVMTGLASLLQGLMNRGADKGLLFMTQEAQVAPLSLQQPFIT